MGTVRALGVAWRAFRRDPAAHRLHVLIRFLTCPFTRVLPAVPRGARVLDVGAGHGLFGVLLVADDAAREVIGVDPDLRKSLLRSPSARVKKVAGFDDCVGGRFDAVVLIDTLYLVHGAERRAIFERAFARLTSGGTLVFKDMDPARRLKLAWGRVQENLNNRFLHVTEGSGFVHQTRAEVEAMLSGIGFVDFEAKAIDRFYPHPHVLYTARKP
jgi:2-polyprenyl-3-methyl-5-hydroxy-6-metoxy-1,4-benzoquinol methylase